MRSRVAARNRQTQLQRFARMTPGERVALSIRLAEQGLSNYMETHGVDRETAVAHIKRTRRLGRRPSLSADAD